MSNSVRDKAIRVYEYLTHLVKYRTSVICDVKNYVDCIWINEIPQHKWCYCRAWDNPDDDEDFSWIEIKKPKLPSLPSIPEECCPWVVRESLYDMVEGPKLHEKKSNEVTNEQGELFIEQEELSNHPDIIKTWDEYVEKQWKAWSEEYKKAKTVQDIYSKLFSMYQQQRSLGESYEIVIGLGLLSYKAKGGPSIYRHIVTAETELIFEPNKGTIIVKHNPEGANLKFETETIDPKEQPPIQIQLDLEQHLTTISNQIWNNVTIHSVIRSWINAFKADASYDENLLPPAQACDPAKANFAPAIILRKRTNRGIIQFINTILKQLKNEGEISANILGLVQIDSTKESIVEPGEEREYGSPDFKQPEIPLLPLQVNEEQLKIVCELQNKKGILVQGPPGTGKSHTIANLICHLLSQGKRILVTSQTSRALKVLKDKIPKDLQALCVSVLGNRQEDLDNLKNAVNDVNNRFFSWDVTKAENRIKKLESELNSLKEKKQSIEVSFRELREKETVTHAIVDNKYSGTAQAIAEQVRKQEKELGWIDDVISSHEVLPISQEEFQRILYLQQKITRERSEELALLRIKTCDIFLPEEFVELVNKEKKVVIKEQQMAKDINMRLLYDKLKRTNVEQRKILLNSLLKLLAAVSEAHRRPLRWINEAVTLMLSDQDQSLKELATISKRYLEHLRSKVTIADDTSISIPKSIDLIQVRADAEDLLKHLKSGKQLGWGLFRPKIYKRICYLLKKVLVNGRLCNNVELLQRLIDYITVSSDLQKLKEAWGEKITIRTGTYFHQVAILSEQLEALNMVLNIKEPLNCAKEAIAELNTVSPPSWYQIKEIENLRESLEATFVVDIKYEIEGKIDDIVTKLKIIIASLNAHPVNKQLLEALLSRDWDKWRKQHDILLSLEEDEKNQADLVALLKRLSQKAELLTAKLSNGDEEEFLKRTDLNFEFAWDWLRADAWLKEFEESHDEYQLQQEFSDVQSKIAKTTADLVALKSWYHCFKTMSENQRQHLIAWSAAIKRLGKGTGKWADKHRKDAQFHMNECRSAIPGWIMPLYRVVDSIVPQPDMFDVLIVDEASQSGPESLFLLYVAKKCIIVGDDQQISPEGIGIDRADMNLLIDKFLYDIPHKDVFGPESSLFTQAEIRFGARIVLKEHFRCVPEIIQFSNDLCYSPLGHNLIPLREYEPDRLQPVVTSYVREGYREGYGQSSINIPEAKAIVQQVISCCKNKMYKKKTMGIISLQGDSQAKYIERLLVEQLGPEEMEERSIICGSAYDFQGDERDAIFISMVAAPNTKIGVLSRETDKRRFNVAASRAKDQMWLFHSCSLNDLSQKCYRYQLLAYCQNPTRIQQDIDPELFDSDFEKEVFNKIREKGYKIIPHFKVAEFEIDMVIEGLKNRLAVECDGEYWHGPEQFEHDMWRQRMLERAGWIFWRVRGSAYYRNSEEALESLWQKLDEMGIYAANKLKVSPEKIESNIPDTDREHSSSLISKIEDNKMSESMAHIASEQSGESEDFRLGKALEHCKRLSNIRGGLDVDLARKSILDFLNQGTQGEDLFPDLVMRSLGIKKRGRERAKLKKVIKRILSDMKREGKIEEYYTDKRTRLRLPTGFKTSLF
jgi:very-short-patch-repair endonuclease